MSDHAFLGGPRLLVLALAFGCGIVAGSPSYGEEPNPFAAGAASGLVVHVGTTDGRTEATLAGSGKALVHGLAATSEAAEEARKEGIKIYSVGIGNPAGETFPFMDRSGIQVGFIKDDVCMGIGMIIRIDLERKEIYILTNVEKDFEFVEFGRIKINEDGEEIGRTYNLVY